MATIVNLDIAGTDVTQANWTATTEAIDYTAILTGMATSLASIASNLASIESSLNSIKNSQITLAAPVSKHHHFVATLGQTSFPINYSPGFITVWRRGVRLISGGDYIATNGTSVDMASPTSAGEEIDIFVLTDSLYQMIGPDEALTRAIMLQNLQATGLLDNIKQAILNPQPFL